MLTKWGREEAVSSYDDTAKALSTRDRSILLHCTACHQCHFLKVMKNDTHMNGYTNILLVIKKLPSIDFQKSA
jgi:hypothetical protein